MQHYATCACRTAVDWHLYMANSAVPFTVHVTCFGIYRLLSSTFATFQLLSHSWSLFFFRSHCDLAGTLHRSSSNSIHSSSASCPGHLGWHQLRTFQTCCLTAHSCARRTKGELGRSTVTNHDVCSPCMRARPHFCSRQRRHRGYPAPSLSAYGWPNVPLKPGTVGREARVLMTLGQQMAPTHVSSAQG